MNSSYKVLLVLIAIILLFVLNSVAGITLAIIMLVFLLLMEPKLVRFFLNPGFLIFAVIALAVPLFNSFSFNELEQNLLIILKGILITFWIYLYTKNFTSSGTYKRIKRFLPGELISLISMSFNIAPAIRQTASKKELTKIEKESYWKQAVNFVYALTKLAESVSQTPDKPHGKKIFILTGKIHEGKTTLASNIVKEASDSGLKVGGILARAEIKDGERIAYYAEDIRTGRTMKLITKEPVGEYYDHFWSYYFLKDGMNFAANCLSLEYLKDSDIAIIDEIGAMELEDRGYNKQLTDILNSNILVVILVIREQFVEKICSKYNFTPTHTITANDSPDAIIKLITQSSTQSLIS